MLRSIAMAEIEYQIGFFLYSLYTGASIKNVYRTYRHFLSATDREHEVEILQIVC